MNNDRVPFAVEEVVKHLEFIQNIISRMASNSFLVKGWSITLVTALFAVGGKEGNPKMVWLALLPALGFWVLDTCFLYWERRFRHLYDYVRLATESELKDIGPFCLDFRCAHIQERSWMNACFAPTNGAFHGSIVALIVVVLVFMKM